MPAILSLSPANYNLYPPPLAPMMLHIKCEKTWNGSYKEIQHI